LQKLKKLGYRRRQLRDVQGDIVVDVVVDDADAVIVIMMTPMSVGVMTEHAISCVGALP